MTNFGTFHLIFINEKKSIQYHKERFKTELNSLTSQQNRFIQNR